MHGQKNRSVAYKGLFAVAYDLKQDFIIESGKSRVMSPNNVDAATVKADANLPTEHGNFRMRVFVDDMGGEHSVLSVGLDDTQSVPIVRIH